MIGREVLSRSLPKRVQMERARGRRRRRNASASVCSSDVSLWKDRDDKVESDFGETSDDTADMRFA
jgi:hypothetical protein